MFKILFVCLGNICRSPMGEFILKDMIHRAGRNEDFFIASAGTSSEEQGNGVYPPAKRELAKHGIDCTGKRAVRFCASDYEKYDYILCMEQRNAEGVLRIAGGDPKGKVFRLSDFSARPRDIADPWYTGDFAAAYKDIEEGCLGFLNYLSKSEK